MVDADGWLALLAVRIRSLVLHGTYDLRSSYPPAPTLPLPDCSVTLPNLPPLPKVHIRPYKGLSLDQIPTTSHGLTYDTRSDTESK